MCISKKQKLFVYGTLPKYLYFYLVTQSLQTFVDIEIRVWFFRICTVVQLLF